MIDSFILGSLLKIIFYKSIFLVNFREKEIDMEKIFKEGELVKIDAKFKEILIRAKEAFESASEVVQAIQQIEVTATKIPYKDVYALANIMNDFYGKNLVSEENKTINNARNDVIVEVLGLIGLDWLIRDRDD